MLRSRVYPRSRNKESRVETNVIHELGAQLQSAAKCGRSQWSLDGRASQIDAKWVSLGSSSAVIFIAAALLAAWFKLRPKQPHYWTCRSALGFMKQQLNRIY